MIIGGGFEIGDMGGLICKVRLGAGIYARDGCDLRAIMRTYKEVVGVLYMLRLGLFDFICNQLVYSSVFAFNTLIL